MRIQQPANQRGQESLGLKKAKLFSVEDCITMLIPLALIALSWLVEASK